MSRKKRKTPANQGQRDVIAKACWRLLIPLDVPRLVAMSTLEFQAWEIELRSLERSKADSRKAAEKHENRKFK